MRKPRDYNAEIEALSDKAKLLKARHVTQLGELVIACKADALSIEMLAGALLATSDADVAAKEVWRKRGVAFFSGRAEPRQGAGAKPGGAASNDGGAQQGSFV